MDVPTRRGQPPAGLVGRHVGDDVAEGGDRVGSRPSVTAAAGSDVIATGAATAAEARGGIRHGERLAGGGQRDVNRKKRQGGTGGARGKEDALRNRRQLRSKERGRGEETRHQIQSGDSGRREGRVTRGYRIADDERHAAEAARRVDSGWSGRAADNRTQPSTLACCHSTLTDGMQVRNFVYGQYM